MAYICQLKIVYQGNEYPYRMNRNIEQLVEALQAGLQEKKGHDIAIVDLSGIDEAVCKAFVICSGNSPSHIQALAESAARFARERLGARPTAVDGMRNAIWVAMDYTDVILHVFLEDARQYYDLEHLWADAPLTEIPDLD